MGEGLVRPTKILHTRRGRSCTWTALLGHQAKQRGTAEGIATHACFIDEQESLQRVWYARLFGTQRVHV